MTKKIVMTLALAVGLSVAVPARDADAAYYNYCGGLVSPHSWCWTGYWDGLISWNRASYPGSGTVHVGIQSYYNFGKYYLCRYMANNYVAATCYVNGGQVGVANGDDGRHTIDGKVDICWGCVLSRMTPPGLHPTALGPSQATLDEIAQMPFVLDAARSRQAHVLDDNASYFTVPGAKRCLFRESKLDTSIAVGCADDAQIAAGQGVIVGDGLDDLAAGMVRVMGMAPDGATSVRIQFTATDRMTEVPVIDGVFVAELPGAADHAPARVEFVSRPAVPSEPQPEESEAGGCNAGGSSLGGASMLAMLGLVLGAGMRRRARQGA
jgi:uncharacterized protein (TIGR03382 family)